MTPETEAQIRARVDAATPGPWVVFDMDEAGKRRDEPLNGPGEGWYFVWSEPRLPHYGAVLEPYRENEAAVGSACIDDSSGGVQEQADATFIAHARTDLPLLLDENARLRAALDLVREVLDHYASPTAFPSDGMVPTGSIVRRLTAALDGTDTTGDDR